MKIALLAHDRFPIAAPFAGGLESFTWYLAKGLRERGIEVVVFAAPGSDPELDVEELAVEPVSLSEQARNDVSMPPEGQVRETISYLQVMTSLAQRDDIDIVHNNSLHYLPIAMAQSLKQPVITTLHTPNTPWMEPALRLSPGVKTAAVSSSIAHMWRDVTSARVIPNGVDLDHWSLGPGGDSLVWSGRIVPEKAPHLAALIAREAGWKLHIAGPLSNQEYYETQLKPLLSDDITYVGHLEPDELHHLVSHSAACLVTPQWEEPYGLVAAESMACGTPVLAIARGGLAEVVRAPGGLSVSPEATDELTVTAAARALSGVVAMDRVTVREHARACCSLDATVDQYVDLYRELVAR